MPSGYTAPIKDGITFSQFALNCARAFGALITMRDEPSNASIPETFAPSPYHQQELARLRHRLAELEGMTVAEIEVAHASYAHDQATAHTKRMAEMDDQRAKYDAMLKAASLWKPPTPDHEPLQRFMVDQITQSIEWDCDKTYYTAPPEITPEQWFNQQKITVLEGINYHVKGDAEEQARTNSRNEWLKALRGSLTL